MNLFARKEPTTDSLLLSHAAKTPKFKLTKLHRDVQLYYNKEATRPAARYPWDYTQSKPTRRNRRVQHNCGSYILVWLPDLA